MPGPSARLGKALTWPGHSPVEVPAGAVEVPSPVLPLSAPGQLPAPGEATEQRPKAQCSRCVTALPAGAPWAPAERERALWVSPVLPARPAGQRAAVEEESSARGLGRRAVRCQQVVPRAQPEPTPARQEQLAPQQ